MHDDALEAALIDLDDTLLMSSEASRLAMRAVVTAVCTESTAEAGRRLYAAWERARSRFWADDEAAQRGRLDPWHARRVTLAASLDACGLEGIDVDSLLDGYAQVKESSTCLAAGATDLLIGLRCRGIGLALITNGRSQDQREKLARFGLSDYFDVILIEEEIGVCKPDERFLTRALGMLCARPTSSVVVGDDVRRDGWGAARVGLHFYHVSSIAVCGYCRDRHTAIHVTSVRQVLDDVPVCKAT